MSIWSTYFGKRVAESQPTRAQKPATQKDPKMSSMKEPNTRVWRHERGLSQKSEAALFYSPNPLVFAKLKGDVAPASAELFGTIAKCGVGQR